MTRVDFYLLDSDNTTSSLKTACRLLDKAYHQGHRVYVECKDIQMAHQLDELLWTFQEDSFIPHHLTGEGPTPAPAIQIGVGEKPQGQFDILLNLGEQIHDLSHRFNRILELVSKNESARHQSRQRFIEYRTKGFSLHTHDLASA